MNQIGLIFLLSLLLSSYMTSDSTSPATIFAFTANADISSWNVLNDGVMGGSSSSSFELNKDGNGVFKGDVSTANNGGFASVRHQLKSLDLKKKSKIKIRLKGDGKSYQFRVKKKNSDAESYITNFKTSGSWETIEINLEELYPSFRGRKLNMPNYDITALTQLSFLIANKKNESFQLLIDTLIIE